MGKQSKDQRKGCKEERGKRLKKFDILNSTILSLQDRDDELHKERRLREAKTVVLKQLNLIQSHKEDLMKISKNTWYKRVIFRCFNMLMILELRCKEHENAYNWYLQAVEVNGPNDPLLKGFAFYSDLALLRLKGREHSKQTFQVVEEVIRKHKNMTAKSVQSFVELVAVEYRRLKKYGYAQRVIDTLWESPYKKGLMVRERLSILCSGIEDLRFGDHSYDEIFKGVCNFSGLIFSVLPLLQEEQDIDPYTLSTGCLIASIIQFFFSYYDKNLQRRLEKESITITKNQVTLVCKDCRAANYCSIKCQRDSFIWHEDIGCKHLGHKSFCPLLKAYRKYRNNQEADKEGHLERKFERASKRFLWHGFGLKYMVTSELKCQGYATCADCSKKLHPEEHYGFELNERWLCKECCPKNEKSSA
ncbi:predicted protein [Chaetoceros tenuissimus]|uniref:MYND-type domain-containing protein n=1 Tax=Chaetoceros tenuissimus TaxID=426638 RepID=A0AAD3HFH5_9STRA|nr:predicted protein [Chaetoceros tenuissimus]